MNESASYDRYQRQLILTEFGEPAQDRLRAASILVIGAGGLGCPLLQYLVAAGAGGIGIVDDDVVSLSNLHRQPLYSMKDIGKLKVTVAAKKLQALNPQVQIRQYAKRITSKNALQIIENYDIIADASDNFATRYLVNDACVLLHKPLVFGAVSKWEGQLAIFNAGDANSAVNYRDLFPQQPEEGTILNCAEAGVLGPLPGIIGTMMANEIIKFVAETGTTLTNKMLIYNSFNNQQFELILEPNKHTKQWLPSGASAFEERDYDEVCSAINAIQEINELQLREFIKEKHTLLLDVREAGELPLFPFPDFKHVALSLLPMRLDELLGNKTIICICKTGVRSRQAAALLSAHFNSSVQVMSLQGGIAGLQQQTKIYEHR